MYFNIVSVGYFLGNNILIPSKNCFFVKYVKSFLLFKLLLNPFLNEFCNIVPDACEFIIPLLSKGRLNPFVNVLVKLFPRFICLLE